MDFKITWQDCSPSEVQVPFEIFVQVRLTVKVTLEDQAIKWCKLGLSESLLLHLHIDFKISWLNHSLSGEEVSFETFVQVG